MLPEHLWEGAEQRPEPSLLMGWKSSWALGVMQQLMPWPHRTEVFSLSAPQKCLLLSQCLHADINSLLLKGIFFPKGL